MSLTRYSTGYLLLTVALLVASVHAADDPQAAAEREKALLAVLRSDAPSGEKAIACKKLAIDGSGAAVADLAKLLPDPQLSSWARIAIEAIPGSESDEALRKAAGTLEGKLLVGTINSIGVRRDAGAVDTLTPRLADKDAEVASAAAVALGRIGNPAAVKALRGSLASAPDKVRSAIAEGCVLSAERLLAAGKAEEAAAIYEEVRKAEVPKQRVLEATRGVILARKQEGLPLLLELLRSDDKLLFQLGLGTARELGAVEVDKALAAELASAKPERAALIVQAMADRPKTVVLSAVEKAAKEGPKEVRLAAVNALARVGDDSHLAVLLDAALDADADLSQAAKNTLADLSGEKINAQILAMLPNAEGKKYPLLIDLVGRRRIDAGTSLLKALDHSDASVRAAALSALGETVDLKGLSVLISQVVAPKNGEDAAAAEKALKAASIRMPDREACAAELVTALDRAKAVPTKITLLQVLGAVGGTKALASVGAAGKSQDADLQDASTKLLGEWMTADAAPVLLDLSKSAPGEKYQVRALRGYIRIVRQFILPEEQRNDMCQKAMEAARQPAEQKLVLEVLKRYPNPETLKLAAKATKNPALKDDADAAVQAISQKLTAKGVNVKELLNKAGAE